MKFIILSKRNEQLKSHGSFRRHSVYNGETQINASFIQRQHFKLQQLQLIGNVQLFSEINSCLKLEDNRRQVFFSTLQSFSSTSWFAVVVAFGVLHVLHALHILHVLHVLHALHVLHILHVLHVLHVLHA
jgi:hypothetical protein